MDFSRAALRDAGSPTTAAPDGRASGRASPPDVSNVKGKDGPGLPHPTSVRRQAQRQGTAFTPAGARWVLKRTLG
jgi:hypothetical protein